MIEAAEVLAIDPDVTLQRLKVLMLDVRDSEDAPEFLPHNPALIATVATLAAVWLLDIAADDGGQDHRQLIDMCVAETSPVQGGCVRVPDLPSGGAAIPDPG